MSFRVEIDPSLILTRRGLGRDHRARVFVAKEVARFSDPYVPMRQGRLKNTVHVASDGSRLTYPQPYAHYQYEGKVYGPNIPLANDGGFYSPEAPKHPTGRDLTYHGAPMRGPHWDKRMMADRKDDLLRSVARYVGGKPK